MADEIFKKGGRAMKTTRPYAHVTITPKGEAALTGGHPWVYAGEITGLSGEIQDGVRRGHESVRPHFGGL